jgi:RNA polymerase sigma factor (sigma-70 family)
LATATSRGRASGVEPIELAFDTTAVAGLYERNAGRLFGYCLSRLGRREDAEDAVQTTFLHAIRGLRRGVVPLIESAWLLGIARNVCLARRESLGRRKRLESVCDPSDLENVAPAREASTDELMGLPEALAALPERQRRAVLLRDWRGLSYDEVAEELGVTRAAVETLIFRGRNALAEQLGEEPATTRKRLASLGNLGSFLSALKALFTGGGAALKLGVAGVVVSSAGLAVTVPASPLAPQREPAPRVVTATAVPGTAAAAVTQAGQSGVATQPAAARVAQAATAQGRAARSRLATPAGTQAPTGEGAAGAAAAAAGSPAAESHAGHAPAAKADGPVKGAVAGPVTAVTTVAKKVGTVVTDPVSALPAQVPPLPSVTLSPVAVPPVTVPPVTLPTVTLPALPPVSAPSLPPVTVPLPVPVPPVSVPPVPVVPTPPVVVTPPPLPPVPPVTAPVAPPAVPPVTPPAPPPLPPVPPLPPLP